MEKIFGSHYTDADLGTRKLPDNTAYLASNRIWRCDSEEGRFVAEQFRARLSRSEVLYLLGFLGTAHNSGLVLVEASRTHLEILANLEEERYSGVKHHSGYPAGCVAEMRRILGERGIDPAQIFAVFYPFDVVEEEQQSMRLLLTQGKVVKGYHLRTYNDAVKPDIPFGPDELRQMRTNMFSHSPAVVHVWRQLVGELGLRPDVPLLQTLHHESHARLAYEASPFSRGEARDRDTLVACIDGGGDVSSISAFRARDGALELLRRNVRADSLPVFHLLCAMTTGGWSALNASGDPRSDNRFMAAASLGNMDRLTNPYYRRLRQYFHFGADGAVHANTILTDNSLSGLQDIIGPFYFVTGDRNTVPDLNQARAVQFTAARVDIAAAVHLVFEDAVFHVLESLLTETKADQLVLCGQAALNARSNARLLERFGPAYYQQAQGRDARLQVWAPPFASDAGAVAGAPCLFALLHGASRLRPVSPFLCGRAADTREIEAALAAAATLRSETLGNIADSGSAVADRMAHLVARGAVVGLFRGMAENGSRALGHRSLLFDPNRTDAADIINSRIKRREPFRPLSPLLTLEAAHELFELEAGAAGDDYDAYRYMIVSARMRAQARLRYPGIAQADGYARIQILRRRDDALLWDYLQALKQRTGLAVSGNSSLNVGTPIVQTPTEALQIFRRTGDMDALFLIARDGEAWMVTPKIAGETAFDFSLGRRPHREPQSAQLERA